MKSPDEEFNHIVRATLTIYFISMAVAFAAGMWVQARFG